MVRDGKPCDYQMLVSGLHYAGVAVEQPAFGSRLGFAGLRLECVAGRQRGREETKAQHTWLLARKVWELTDIASWRSIALHPRLG
jgi:hypothetical protein